MLICEIDTLYFEVFSDNFECRLCFFQTKHKFSPPRAPPPSIHSRIRPYSRRTMWLLEYSALACKVICGVVRLHFMNSVIRHQSCAFFEFLLKFFLVTNLHSWQLISIRLITSNLFGSHFWFAFLESCYQKKVMRVLQVPFLSFSEPVNLLDWHFYPWWELSFRLITPFYLVLTWTLLICIFWVSLSNISHARSSIPFF